MASIEGLLLRNADGDLYMIEGGIRSMKLLPEERTAAEALVAQGGLAWLDAADFAKVGQLEKDLRAATGDKHSGPFIMVAWHVKAERDEGSAVKGVHGATLAQS